MKDRPQPGDARAIATAAAARRQAEIAAGCELLELAAMWADCHPAEGIVHEHTPLALAGERSMRFGGDGTPDVAEFAPHELGLEIRMSPGQARALIADAVDLRHRFPLLWSRIERADVPAWQARRVADRTRALSRQQARLVDRRLSRIVGQLSKTRLDNLIDAELLRVDRDRAERAAEAASRFRGVRVGQGQDGVSEILVRADTPDVLWSKAQICRLADILMTDPTRLPAGVPDRGARARDEWESVAAMLLSGRPWVAARILAEHEQPDLLLDLPVEDALVESAQPTRSPSEQLIRDVARRIDPEKSAPTVVLHVHVGAEALPGLALLRRDKCRPRYEADLGRVEGVGPVLLSTVRQWLGSGCKVKLQPVIDPDRMPAVDAYEVPDRMVDALLTRSPLSVFPWSSSTGHRMDVDHTIRYARPPGGPPGQTGLHNLGPMSRREHRFKTFGRVAVRQPVPGTFVWRTRFGRVIITNPSGTHDLGTGAFVDALWKLVSAGEWATAA